MSPIHDILTVTVTKLRKDDTFEEMYENIPFKDFDCDGWTMDEMINGTYEFTLRSRKKSGEHWQLRLNMNIQGKAEITFLIKSLKSYVKAKKRLFNNVSWLI